MCLSLYFRKSRGFSNSKNIYFHEILFHYKPSFFFTKYTILNSEAIWEKRWFLAMFLHFYSVQKTVKKGASRIFYLFSFACVGLRHLCGCSWAPGVYAHSELAT